MDKVGTACDALDSSRGVEHADELKKGVEKAVVVSAGRRTRRRSHESRGPQERGERPNIMLQ